jgi:hypothetical protein
LTEGDKCTVPYLYRTVNSNIAARAGMTIPGNSTTGSNKPKTAAVDGSTVRTALMILHQHNCLFIDPPKNTDKGVEPTPGKGATQTGFLYSLNVGNVLHRLNFARMLSIVRQKYGDLAMHVAEAVMLHGKMRLDQVQEHVVLERSNAASAAEIGHAAPPVTHYDVKVAFETLVSNRFIVTVPFVDRARSEPTVTFSFADEGRSSAKRAFEFLSDNSNTGAGAAPTTKRSKTTLPASTAAIGTAGKGNKRTLAQKAAPAALDDGIPVELRMMLGLGDVPTMSNAGKKGASAEPGMGMGANMAHRSTREAPEAEFEDDAAGEYSPLRRRVGVRRPRAVHLDHVCVFAVLCGHLVQVWCTMSRPYRARAVVSLWPVLCSCV